VEAGIYALPDEYVELQQAVRGLAQDKIAPRAAEIDAAAGFTAAGHTVISIGNAEQVGRTEIAYPPGEKEQAEVLKEFLPGAKLTESGDVSDVTVTLGTDFRELANVPEQPNAATARSDRSSDQPTAPIAGTGVGAGSGADSPCS